MYEYSICMYIILYILNQNLRAANHAVLQKVIVAVPFLVLHYERDLVLHPTFLESVALSDSLVLSVLCCCSSAARLTGRLLPQVCHSQCHLLSPREERQQAIPCRLSGLLRDRPTLLEGLLHNGR